MYELAPIDYYFLRESEFSIKFAFEFYGKIDQERLKRAILDLQFYEPILRSGIIYKDENTVSLSPLKNYELDFTFEENSIDLPDDIIRNKFPIIQNLPEKNLFKVKFIEGPLKSFLLVSMSHLLGDGHSFFLVLRAISKFYENDSYQPFVHKRKELDMMSPLLTHLSDEELLQQVFKYSGYTYDYPQTHHLFLTEEMKYSQSGLTKLLELARNQGLRFTPHILMMSLLTKEKAQYMKLYQNKILVRTPVDYRRKLDLTENFFGNAICDAYTIFSREEVMQGDIFAIAQKIKESIQEINFQHVYKQTSALKTLRERKGIKSLRALTCPGTVFTNFSQMPLHLIKFNEQAAHRMIYGELYPNFVLMQAKARDRYPLLYHH